MTRAKLSQTKPLPIELTRTKMIRTKLNRTKLIWAKLIWIMLTQIELTQSKFIRTKLIQTKLTPTKPNRIELIWTRLGPNETRQNRLDANWPRQYLLELSWPGRKWLERLVADKINPDRTDMSNPDTDSGSKFWNTLKVKSLLLRYAVCTKQKKIHSHRHDGVLGAGDCARYKKS